MTWCTLSCGKCGHVDDFDNFCRTTISGDLPKGQYQCPACRHAFKRQESDHRIIRAGKEAMIIPGKVELVTVDSRL